MAKLSLCMIAKDDEKLITDAIKSVKSIVDEIIVVDTGSKDKTPEAAKKLGANVFSHKWKNDFSEARNFSIKKAKTDWILVLDSDEVIAKSDLKKLKSLTDAECDGYLFLTRNYSNDPSGIGWMPVKENIPETKGFTGFYLSAKIRLFRNKKEFYFTGKVHETVDESMKNAGILRTDIPVHHYQELKGKENLKEKQLEYLELCKEKVKKDKKDFKSYHDMAVVYLRFKNDLKKAEKCIEKALKINPRYVPALLDMGTIFLHAKNYDRAIEYYEKALKVNSAALSAYNNLGIVYTAKKEYDKAIKAYEMAIKLNHPRREELLHEIKTLKSLLKGHTPITIGYSFKFGE